VENISVLEKKIRLESKRGKKSQGRESQGENGRGTNPSHMTEGEKPRGDKGGRENEYLVPRCRRGKRNQGRDK